MNHNSLTSATMKSIKYIIVISILTLLGSARIMACGPYFALHPCSLFIFRSCSPALIKEWQNGLRFQEFEKEQNCLLWQTITSQAIPVRDIEKIVYDASLDELQNLSAEGSFDDNTFADWLRQEGHKEDLDYLLTAKEIQQIREYMIDPWYYENDNDEEHRRLADLLELCESYNGKRHKDRYALQTVRLYFARKDFQPCIDLWENSIAKLQQNIVTDMIASYIGGAYFRKGNRDKAIELFTRSGDIGSLISMNAWQETSETSKYKDNRVKELDYIFQRFPNSPLLSVKLQEYIRNREVFVYGFMDWEERDFHDPVDIQTIWVRDSLVADEEKEFYSELKDFTLKVINSKDCRQKGMWLYSLAFLHYLDGDINTAKLYLNRAERMESSSFIQESIRAFRFLLNAHKAYNNPEYISMLMKDLQWIDSQMKADLPAYFSDGWQYDNKLNLPVYYWQDVIRRVLLAEVCPGLIKSGNIPLALQLANYASNRILELSPIIKEYGIVWDEDGNRENYSVLMAIEKFRSEWEDKNFLDYSNQFFEFINKVSAKDAASYAERIINPRSDLDKFLNERSYTDYDYICEIVGTLYLREMNYDKAVEWLSKVSSSYQGQTNLAKEGYFKLDPFLVQFDKKQYIPNSSDYKLRFAQEMSQLERMIHSDAEPNRKANAKIRYAIGLRNSFGSCWYLTQYHFGSCSFKAENGELVWAVHPEDRDSFHFNPFATKAYKKVDKLFAEALKDFTDPEQAAYTYMEMMNFKSLMSLYPSSKAAAMIRGRCDSYHDYALQKR